MVNIENSPVRTFTLYPNHVIFAQRYGQLVLENTLKERGEIFNLKVDPFEKLAK